MKLELPVGETAFTGLVLALFSAFMLGAGPFEVFFPIKLSKSMLMLPALLHVDPMGIAFFIGSVGALLLVELLLDDVLDGRRMLSAAKSERKVCQEKFLNFFRILKFIKKFCNLVQSHFIQGN